MTDQDVNRRPLRRTRKIAITLACVCTLSAVAFTFIPDLQLIARGLARGERFYRGMPTSYWSKRVDDTISVMLTPYSHPRPRRAPRPGWLWRASLAPDEPATSFEAAKKLLRLSYVSSQAPLPLRGNDVNAIPILIDLLEDQEPCVRMYAAESLGLWGPRAPSAVAPLNAHLHDDEGCGLGYSVGEVVAEALRAIAPDALPRE
jgi:hypothetical protein